MPPQKNRPLLPSHDRLVRLSWFAAVVWTIVLVAALALRIRENHADTRQAALTVAHTHFNKDQVFRLWAAERGGVYVPIDEHVQPSASLEHVPNRDVTVTGNHKLTLLDPANLVRQLAMDYPELYGVTGHVTSLAPLSADNAPDPWERTALAKLAGGASEVTEFVSEGGAQKLRLMHPMVTREACIKCHPDQAGSVGRTLGGVSVTVPMAPMLVAEDHANLRAGFLLGLVWLLGLAGIAVVSRALGHQVSRRREAVQELQRAHDLLQQESDVYRAGPVVVFRCRDDEGWPVDRISENVEHLLGYAPGDFATGGVSLATVVRSDDLARLLADARGAGQSAGFSDRPYCFLHRDGREVWVLANVIVQERTQAKPGWLQGYFVDISGREHAEAALRESEERLDLAIEAAELGVWDWDVPSGSVVFSARWAQMIGHEPHEIQPTIKAWEDRLHPDDVPGVTAILEAHLAGKTAIYRAEFRMRAKDGSWVWILATGKVITRDAEGRPIRAVGLHQDITARKNAEAARELVLERFRSLIESLQMGILVETAERRIIQANRTFCDLFGIPDPAMLLGVDCGDAARGAAQLFTEPEAFGARVAEIMALGDVVVNEEMPLKDGRVFERDYVPVNLQGVFLGNMWIYRDITRRKRMEKELVQQERLAAVGQLSAGIAHDFNNILTSIMGFTELLQAAPETPDSMQTNLQRIGDSSRRAAMLVRQILDFSQKTIRRVQKVDLEACVREAAGFLRATLPESVRIDLVIDPGNYTLEAEPAQIHQMITNLAINARDAMDGDGELRLHLSVGAPDEAGTNCSVCGQPIDGAWFKLEVGDTGTGMPPEVLSRVFEPFFTTKRVGEGTGLGVPQAAGIAAQSGGHMIVRSTVGQGTTFTVFLPPAKADKADAEPATPALARGRDQLILLVEDEESVREAITAMLQHLGYRVLAAGSGREALDLFVQPDICPDLVLTDVVMPDLDGEGLCAQLRLLRPDVKIVAMSGYPLGSRGAGLLELGAVAWVQKPMAIEQLAQVVAGVLGGGK
jgi:PAS domain S-box-containing protein